MNRVAKRWGYRKRRVCPREDSRLWLNIGMTTAIMQSEPLTKTVQIDRS